MAAKSVEETSGGRLAVPAPRSSGYDPFVRGRFPVGVRTFEARDAARDRLFPCEIWYPAASRHAGQDTDPQTQDLFTAPLGGAPRRQTAVRDAEAEPGTHPLIVFSHHSGGHRGAATFLCTHLGSHGYVVAALDHSEVVAPELGRREGETEAQRAARVDGWVASRVPDVRFLLDHLLAAGGWDAGHGLDAARVGIVGHSFGGWTALATPDVEPRIRARGIDGFVPGPNTREAT